MAKYASGKFAKAICDRTGWEVPYNQLKREWTGLMVHRSVWEPKHPQLTPRKHINDPQALRNPRPDAAPGRDRGRAWIDEDADGGTFLFTDLTGWTN